MRRSDQVATNKAVYFSCSCFMTRKRRTHLILAWHCFHAIHRGYQINGRICDECMCHRGNGKCFSWHIYDTRPWWVIRITTVYGTAQRRWIVAYKTNYHNMQIPIYLFIFQLQFCCCNHALLMSFISVSVCMCLFAKIWMVLLYVSVIFCYVILGLINCHTALIPPMPVLVPNTFPNFNHNLWWVTQSLKSYEHS